MSKKVVVTFSIPIRVKGMLDELAKANYSSNTKYIVDIITKDYAFWFGNKNIKEEKNNE